MREQKRERKGSEERERKRNKIMISSELNKTELFLEIYGIIVTEHAYDTLT